MFDRIVDPSGNEWQTKAFECGLFRYEVGDRIPAVEPDTYQVEILGGLGDGFTDSLATVREGVLVSVHDDRDPTLPLIDYGGYLRTDI
jgi:hypothetical protein